MQSNYSQSYRPALGANQTGIITIEADSLTLGYYPEFFTNQDSFQLDDLGFSIPKVT
jgi:hypothetical protein